MMARKTLLATFGFGQSMGFAGGTATAQFADDLCQTDPLTLQCEDAGCGDFNGKCEPQQAQLPPHGPTDEPETQQGCVCNTPELPQKQCQFVHNEMGQTFCADLGCPPIQDYNCDPISCFCPEPQEFGDDRCQPAPFDPTFCEDFGCSAMGPGWECEPTQGQEPHPAGEPQVGIGGCKCKAPPDIDPQGSPHCDVVFPFPPGPPPFCVDLGCGGMAEYDCEFIPDQGICDCICDSVIPGPDLTMIFTSKIDFEWTGIGELCANVFNVYKQTSPKLPDVFPAPGIADDYGSCLFNGLLVNHATDFVAPSTGDTSHYLVTAESPAGEGSLGPATVGPRPFSALTPQCPTPPPLP